VVKPWRGRLPTVCADGNGRGELVLLSDSPDRTVSSYDEAIRTLRNSILLTDFDRRLRSILVTSAVPGEGKSTVAAHLAVAHARQKQKTLLVDADLRRPSVHKRFQVPGTLGLSTVLVSGTPWQEVLARLESLPELDILPAGPPSRRAADLVGRGLPEILDAASAQYDLVILDAPPLLGFAEPLQMATAVDGVIVVTLAGETNRKAVASVLSTLQRLRANVVGLVLNEISSHTSDTYYYHGYYGKYYKYYKPNRE
jgi:capsular exopolysaccharide synthesis family protein